MVTKDEIKMAHSKSIKKVSDDGIKVDIPEKKEQSYQAKEQANDKFVMDQEVDKKMDIIKQQSDNKSQGSRK